MCHEILKLFIVTQFAHCYLQSYQKYSDLEDLG